MEKPRRTFGTPTYKIRNKFAAAVIAVGALFGVGYNISSLSNKLRQSVTDGAFNKTEEEIDRRNLMSNVSIISPNRGSTLKEKIALEKEFATR